MTTEPPGAIPPDDRSGWVVGLAGRRFPPSKLQDLKTPLRRNFEMMHGALASLAVETNRREDVCAILGEPYDPACWNDWRWQMRHRFTRLEQFEKLLDLTESERRGLVLASEK